MYHWSEIWYGQSTPSWQQRSCLCFLVFLSHLKKGKLRNVQVHFLSPSISERVWSGADENNQFFTIYYVLSLLWPLLLWHDVPFQWYITNHIDMGPYAWKSYLQISHWWEHYRNWCNNLLQISNVSNRRMRPVKGVLMKTFQTKIISRPFLSKHKPMKFWRISAAIFLWWSMYFTHSFLCIMLCNNQLRNNWERFNGRG